MGCVASKTNSVHPAPNTAAAPDAVDSSARDKSKQSTNDKLTDTPLKATLLVIGPASSGKSSLVSQWCRNSGFVARPTIGFELDRLKSRAGFDLSVYGLGGATNIKNYWTAYYDAAHAIVYVVDASRCEQQYWDSAKADYENAVRHSMVDGKPVQVLANARAAAEKNLSSAEVAARLGVSDSVVGSVDCSTQPTNSDAVLDAFLSSLFDVYSTVNARVLVDVETRKLAAKAEMEKRREEQRRLKEAEAQQLPGVSEQ